MGEGTALYMNFALTTALANGTSVTFEVITSASATYTPTVIGSSAITTAALTLVKTLLYAKSRHCWQRSKILRC